MNQGVEILLKRMGSNPDEFQVLVGRSTKWDWLVAPLSERGWALANPDKARITDRLSLAYLSDEEVLALHKKLLSVQGESFTQKVIQTILQEPEPIAK